MNYNLDGATNQVTVQDTIQDRLFESDFDRFSALEQSIGSIDGSV